MNLKLKQALDIWNELILCMLNKNEYGGNIAEIYAYRLIPMDSANAIGGGLWEKEYAEAKTQLCRLIRYFCEKWGVKAKVAGYKVEVWEKMNIEFRHRVLVEIINS